MQEQINSDIKKAMLAKDEAALRALRGIKSAFLLAATEKGASETLSEEKMIQVLQKLAKQRKDSYDIYIQNGRPELAEKEKEELDVIAKYLPAQMSEEEVKTILKNIIAETGATKSADTGKVMPVAMKQLAGKADGKLISSILKELLS
ncbi:MAG: GatB/YqeY domain-containing protein [Bacteroidetes bacterium]|nr:GatB/YqeY domain-containing protein [Bacteroidota bacterium]